MAAPRYRSARPPTPPVTGARTLQATSTAWLPGLRDVRDTDAAGLVALVGAAYAEHPGCVLDLPGVDDDLPEPAVAAARRGGRWWVLPAGGRIVASIGTGPRRDDGHLELKRLYLDVASRGRGLASRAIGLVEAHAAGLGAHAVDLWSDSRFLDAHRRYAALGYRDTGERRQLHDPSDTTEHRFVKALDPVPPVRRVGWRGPFGSDDAAVHALADGWSLRGRVGGIDTEVEVDGRWRTRRARVGSAAWAVTVTSDGEGRWWRDGRRDDAFDGCTDVDVEVTPLTATPPIRRLALPVGAGADVAAVWLRPTRATAVRSDQRYLRTDVGYRRTSPDGALDDLEVDDDGLVVRCGERWTRAGPA